MESVLVIVARTRRLVGIHDAGDRSRRGRTVDQGPHPGQPARHDAGPSRRHRPGPRADRHRLGRPGLLGCPRRRAHRLRRLRRRGARGGHHPPPPRPPRSVGQGAGGLRGVDRDARAGHRDRAADPGEPARPLVLLHGGQAGVLGRPRGARGPTARGPHGPALHRPAHLRPRAPRPRDRPRRAPRPGGPPPARDLDPGPHARPRLPPPGGDPPGRPPRQRPPLLRRPPAPEDHPAHRPVRGSRRRHRRRSPRRLSGRPGARRAS